MSTWHRTSQSPISSLGAISTERLRAVLARRCPGHPSATSASTAGTRPCRRAPVPGADAFTLGEYIFYTRAACPDATGTHTQAEVLASRSHRIVHVVEFQELGSIQMLDYVNQSYNLHYGGTACKS